jgi:hypothetical protein
MRTLIISAITCLLMASCQTNDVGRYQYLESRMQWLDTKEGILYDSEQRTHLATHKNEVWVEGAWIVKD